MFVDLTKEMYEEFNKLQDCIYDAIGGNVKDIIDEMPNIKLFNFGDPPFIMVYGDDTALFLVDVDGNCHRLPPLFNVQDDMMSDEYDAVHSIPWSNPFDSSEISTMRFFPVDACYEFPINEEDEDVVISKEYFDLVENMYERYISGIQGLSENIITRRLLPLQKQLLYASEELGVELDEVVRSPDVQRGIYSIFSFATESASARMSELLDEALPKDVDEDGID